MSGNPVAFQHVWIPGRRPGQIIPELMIVTSSEHEATLPTGLPALERNCGTGLGPPSSRMTGTLGDIFPDHYCYKT